MTRRDSAGRPSVVIRRFQFAGSLGVSYRWKRPIDVEIVKYTDCYTAEPIQFQPFFTIFGLGADQAEALDDLVMSIAEVWRNAPLDSPDLKVLREFIEEVPPPKPRCGINVTKEIENYNRRMAAGHITIDDRRGRTWARITGITPTLY